MTFQISAAPVGEPVVATPSQVRELAARLGNAFAARAIAVTEPNLVTDQTRIQWERRRSRGGEEIRVQSGELRLTLRQRIVLSSDLTECQARIWVVHEREHVTDNEGILDDLEQSLVADTDLMEILNGARWFSRREFSQAQTSIREGVGRVFRERTRRAAAARDTPQEYSRVEERIAAECH